MPFSYELHKKHRAAMYRSDASTPEAKELQALYDSGKSSEYEARKSALVALGHKFRLTATKVYQIYDEPDRHCDVRIKFQVKGNVITWAFLSPMDETHQSFRDILYGTAADAHESVEFGCDKYYRGTNAYHLKKMHSHAGESDFNHNHYRRSDGKPITPKEVAEHLRAFSAHKNGRLFFPDPSEVEHLIHMYSEYWREWTAEIKREMPLSIGLSTLKTQYETERSQAFNADDKKEERDNIGLENPCRVDVSAIPSYQLEAMKLLRMRGLGSELAHTRQAEGSTKRTVATVVTMDDRSVSPVPGTPSSESDSARSLSPSSPSPSLSSVRSGSDLESDSARSLSPSSPLTSQEASPARSGSVVELGSPGSSPRAFFASSPAKEVTGTSDKTAKVARRFEIKA